MKLVLILAGGLSVAVASPSVAQTTGVFDMGQLTGTLSQDAVTQSEERRAGHERPARRAKPSRTMAENCAFLRARVDRLTPDQYSLYERGCLR